MMLWRNAKNHKTTSLKIDQSSGRDPSPGIPIYGELTDCNIQSHMFIISVIYGYPVSSTGTSQAEEKTDWEFTVDYSYMQLTESSPWQLLRS